MRYVTNQSKNVVKGYEGMIELYLKCIGGIKKYGESVSKIIHSKLVMIESLSYFGSVHQLEFLHST